MRKLLTLALLALGFGTGLVVTNLKTSFLKKKDTTYNVNNTSVISNPYDGNKLEHLSTVPDFNWSSSGFKKVDLSDLVKSQVKTLNTTSDRILVIDDVIDGSVTQIADHLRINDDGQPFYLFINSPGGSVVAGASVISAMKAIKSPVYTICYQMCASMAFITHQYGTKRYMMEYAILMSHWASGGAQGDLERMLSLNTFFKSYVDRFSEDIAKRAKMPQEQYQSLISKDLWMDDRQASKLGFSDGIIDLKLVGSKENE